MITCLTQMFLCRTLLSMIFSAAPTKFCKALRALTPGSTQATNVQAASALHYLEGAKESDKRIEVGVRQRKAKRGKAKSEKTKRGSEPASRRIAGRARLAAAPSPASRSLPGPGYDGSYL